MTTFNSIPLLKLLLPFSLGIIVSSYFPFYPEELVYICVSCYTLLLVAVALKWWIRPYTLRFRFGLLLSIALMLSGYVLPQLQNPKYNPHYFDYYRTEGGVDTVLVRILQKPEQTKNSLKWTTSIVGYLKDGEIKPAKGKLLLYAEPTNTTQLFQYGDELLIHLRIEALDEPKNPREFNYKRYLKHHYIFHRGYVKAAAVQKVAEGRGNLLTAWAIKSQNELLKVFRNYGIRGDEYAVLSALVLGYKDHLDFEITQAFSSAGAMHVLAVSGLHVGIVLLLAGRLLSPLPSLRYGKIVKVLLELLAVWAFALITGMSASVIRAATMFSFLAIGKSMHRHTNVYNTLAAAAFFTLLVRPYMIMEVGFQLSFLAVLGIVWIQPKLYGLWEPKHRIVDWIWTITTVSIAAQLATAPLGLLYFHQFPNYFILSNLVVIPAAFILVTGGVALFSLSALPALAEPFALLLNTIVQLLNDFVQLLTRLPYHTSAEIDISIVETYLIYLALIILIHRLFSQRAKRFIFPSFVLLLVLSWQVIEDRVHRANRELVVYAVNGHTAINLIVGTEHQFLSTASLLNESSTLQFNIRHYWWHKDLNAPDTVLLKDSVAYHLPLNDSLDLMIERNAHHSFENTGETPLILVAGGKRQPSEGMMKRPLKQVVLDGSLHWKARKAWKKWGKNKGIPVHDVRELGAFRLDLSAY